ncbi:uncharacterized protein V6R79_000615 [Siganus canaliculatus]
MRQVFLLATEAGYERFNCGAAPAPPFLGFDVSGCSMFPLHAARRYTDSTQLLSCIPGLHCVTLPAEQKTPRNPIFSCQSIHTDTRLECRETRSERELVRRHVHPSQAMSFFGRHRICVPGH